MMMLRPLNAARRALRTPPFALGLHRQASAAALPHVLRNVGVRTILTPRLASYLTLCFT